MNMKMKPLRAAKALYSLVQLVRDPEKLGQVFEMADALAEPAALAELVAKIAAENPAVDRALDERHRFTIDLAALRRLPAGTLGRVFADDMIAAGLDPSALPDLASPDRASFFRAHLYETHDVWHAVTGFGMDRLGELALQAFYLAQIGGGLPTLLLAVGFLRISLYEVENARALMDGIIEGYEMGKKAKAFFGVHWDELWSLPLAEVRRRLGVEVAELDAPTRLAA
jgi:ubiquinone biosynthesis protein Coq4